MDLDLTKDQAKAVVDRVLKEISTKELINELFNRGAVVRNVRDEEGFCLVTEGRLADRLPPIFGTGEAVIVFIDREGLVECGLNARMGHW